MYNNVYPPTARPRKKSKLPLIIILTTVLCLLLAFCVIVSSTLLGFAALVLGSSSSFNVLTPPATEYLGVLYIEGTIASSATTGALYSSGGSYYHNYTLNAIIDLANDENNKGILLYIDTPGGEIYATDELYNQLLWYKQVTDRPIYAYFATMACSGGYYAAMAADEIYAHRMCTTGSIGVSYGTHIDISALCENLGIKTEDLVSGDNKAMGSYFSPLTDEQREIYQSQLDEYYGYFVDVVEEGRGMSEEDVKALADGRTYTATQALEAGLIDGISSFGDYCNRIEETFPDITYYHIQYEATYLDLLSSLGYKSSASTPTSQINELVATLKPMQGVLVYYSGN